MIDYIKNNNNMKYDYSNYPDLQRAVSDTGHIHQLSIRDFISLVKRVGGLEIVEK
jgi:hypothetical protein